DGLAVGFGKGQLTRGRAGGDDDLVSRHGLADLLRIAVAVVVVAGRLQHFNGAWAVSGFTRDDPGVALDVIDLVLLEQEGDAVVQLAGDIAASSDNARPVNLDLGGIDVDAPFFALHDGRAV